MALVANKFSQKWKRGYAGMFCAKICNEILLAKNIRSENSLDIQKYLGASFFVQKFAIIIYIIFSNLLNIDRV